VLKSIETEKGQCLYWMCFTIYWS